MKRTKLFLITVFVIICMTISGCGKKTDSENATTTSMETMPAQAPTGGASDKVPDPNAPVVERVVIYYIKEDKSGLDQSMDEVDVLDADHLMAKLAAYGIVSDSMKVLEFKNEKKGLLNLSELPKTDIQTLTAIANTFIANFELDSLTIETDGKSINGASNMPLNDSGYQTLK